MKKPDILFLVGPTASGKSGLAVALAKRLNGEIISADSMLIYKGMDIGTAKLTKKERQGVRHHGIDLIPPTRNFSVFAYRRFALKTIKDVVKRGKLPIVTGGTGFYVRALLEGLSPQPGANAAIRRKLEAEAKESGLPALYQRLLKVDRKRALQIGTHNQRRIIRALEIYLISGRKPSQPSEKSPGLRKLGYKPLVLGLHRQRQALYQTINQRVDQMFRKGLVCEVKRLAKIKLSVTASQGVGYKQLLDVLKKGSGTFFQNKRCLTPSRSILKEIREKIKQDTRHFAKRQWTWFKREKGIRWIWWPENATVANISDFILNNFFK